MNRKWFITISIILILILASYLRLYRIAEYQTFLGDEGRDVLRIKRMLVDGDIILLGPTASVGGFFLGPMYYYFITPFLWLWQYDPVGPAIMVALFGIATVYLVYYVGSKWFHPTVGLTASLLYSLSPVVIAYSRSSWNPNIVPFFSLLLMFILWRSALYKKLRDYFFIGIIWGLGLQFHYLFSFLIIISGIWLLTFARPLRLVKHYGAVVAGFVLSFSPFILFELIHNFQNIKAMFAFITSGNETGFTPLGFVSTVADVLFRSFGRLLFRMPNYEVWNQYPDTFITTLVIIIRTVVLVSVALLISLILSNVTLKKKIVFTQLHKRFSLSKEQWIASILLLIWMGISILLFGFYRRGIYDYYFGIFNAAPFMLLGLIFWQSMRSKAGTLLASAVFLGLAIYNWQGRPFVYQPNNQVQQTRNVAKEVIKMAGDEPFNFAFITATNSDHAYRYFLEIENKAPVTIEQIAADPERKTVTNQLIVMCENPSCEPLGNSLWEVAGFGRAEIVERKDVFPVTLYKLVHYDENEASSSGLIENEL